MTPYFLGRKEVTEIPQFPIASPPVVHFYQAERCYLGSPCLRCCLRCVTDTAGWEVAWRVTCSTGVSIPTQTSSPGLQPPHPVHPTFPLPLPEQYQPALQHPGLQSTSWTLHKPFTLPGSSLGNLDKHHRKPLILEHSCGYHACPFSVPLSP